MMRISRIEDDDGAYLYNVMDGDHVVAAGDIDFCVAVIQGRVKEFERRKYWQRFKPVEESLWVNIRRLDYVD